MTDGNLNSTRAETESVEAKSTVTIIPERASEQPYQHWQLEYDADNILWLKLDRQQAAVNSLDLPILTELDLILNEVLLKKPIAVIITSAKANGFVAGADITQFTQLSSMQQSFDLMRQAQQIFSKLAALPMPTVAAIHGFCLGGGMELALACRYRIAADGANTSLGLPEVTLGLHPGWGGTVRMPRLIGIIRALHLMILGQSLSATEALEWHVVDALVPLGDLAAKAKHFALQQPLLQRAEWWQRHCHHGWIRGWLSSYFYKSLQRHVNKAHYPAAYVIVDNWRADGASGTPESFIQEAASISALLMTHGSQQLIRLFLLRSKLKAVARGTTALISKVHIIGCGELGNWLAIKMAQQGLQVSLQDSDPSKIQACLRHSQHVLKVEKVAAAQQQLILERLSADSVEAAIASADVIIEAVPEDLALKQKVLTQVGMHKQEHALVLTTSSTLPLDLIAQELPDPSVLVGLHVLAIALPQSEVIEVVAQTNTPAAYVTQAAALVNKLNNLPLVVTATPGYLFYRILMPYLFEAMHLLAENLLVCQIDQAMLDFGMGLEPLALADAIGLDVCARVAQQLPALANQAMPTILQQKIAAGHLGRKTGQGFYDYPRQSKNKLSSSMMRPHTPKIIARLLPQLLNSAVNAYFERVVEQADWLDAAIVYGAGFAAFQGGPLAYVRYHGIDTIAALLEKLMTEQGGRYAPLMGWDDSTLLT